MSQISLSKFITGLSILVFTLPLAGCEPNGPATTDTDSSEFISVDERTEFLNEYVTFRRTYDALDFDIKYQNNDGGLVPGPSDWDIRLVAIVPASELQAWVPAGVDSSSAPDVSWLDTVPTSLDLTGVNEWYVDGKKTIGIDPDKRIVVYRKSTM